MDFALEVSRLGISLNESQFKKFQNYYDYLIAINQVMNLTAITEQEEVYRKHFLDSLELYRILSSTDSFTLCDVGSGAGFPAVPLAIVNSAAHFTMIDSLNKRISFLNDLIQKLSLRNAEAIHARAEEYVLTKRGSFDVVTARAVAKLNILCELCMPLVRVGGRFIAMKGSSGKEELKESKAGIALLGGQLEQVVEFELPVEQEKRQMIVIKKIKDTPSSYPRSYAKIKEKPL